MLKSYSYSPGNLNEGGSDSFHLVFNSPVTFNHIYYKSQNCLPDLKFIVSSDSMTVTFYNFFCGGLGGSYPFEYQVTDDAGVTVTDSVTFNGYDRKIPLAGSPEDYFITDDDNFCWVATRDPNQMVCFSTTDTSFRKIINLNFQPYKSVYNYYNNKIYILPSPEDFQHRDSIFVMNPENGVMEKAIYVPKQRITNTEQFGRDIAFGSNGYGMLKVDDENYTMYWLVIDSHNNDSIYTHRSVVDSATVGGFNMTSFKMCFPNFDKSKIIGLEEFGSCRIGVLDCFTQTLTEVEWPMSPHCYSSYLVVNKVKNDVFMVNLQVGDGQFMVSDNSVVGVSTDLDAYGNSEADFSYRPMKIITFITSIIM